MGDIKNQRHTPVTENGGATEHLVLRKNLSQGFDHRLQLTNQLIHHYTRAVTAKLQHHQTLARTVAWRQTEQATQAHIGQRFATQVEQIMQVWLLPQIDTLDHLIQRQHKGLIGNPYLEAVDNRKSQWQADAHRGALTEDAEHLDLAAQFFDIAAHHIHAHAAPG